MSLSGNLPSSTFVSWRQSTSGARSFTKRATRSIRNRTELIFHVVIVNRMLGRSALEPAAEVVELIERGVADSQLSAFAAMVQRDSQAEEVAHRPLERDRVGVLRHPRPADALTPRLAGLALGDRL